MSAALLLPAILALVQPPAAPSGPPAVAVGTAETGAPPAPSAGAEGAAGTRSAPRRATSDQRVPVAKAPARRATSDLRIPVAKGAVPSIELAARPSVTPSFYRPTVAVPPVELATIPPEAGRRLPGWLWFAGLPLVALAGGRDHGDEEQERPLVPPTAPIAVTTAPEPGLLALHAGGLALLVGAGWAARDRGGRRRA